MSTWLGIDIGTSSMKGALYSDGCLNFFSGRYLPGTLIDFSHQSPELFAESFQVFCREIMEQSGISGSVECLALSCHGPSLIAADQQGRPLGGMPTWQDNSALNEAGYLFSVYANKRKDATSWEAKCLADFRSRGKNPPRYYLFPKDYINYLLTGCFAFDESTASTLSFYDKETGIWKPETIGIPVDFFPPVVPSHGAVGVTSTEFSRLCGLPDGVTVLGGGIDAYCEAAGAGGVNIGDIVDGSGTSTCLSICNPRHTGDLHVIPDKGLTMEVMSNTGSAIQWYSELVGTDSKKMTSLPKFSAALFLPYLNGERSPYWDEKLQGAFIGLTNDSESRELYQAVLQGITFGIRQNMEALLEKSSASIILTAGGGAENALWLQLKANIIGKPYACPEYKDAAPVGCLYLCSCYCGSSEDFCQENGIPKLKYVVEPDVSENERQVFDELYGQFKEVTKQLETNFHLLSDIRQRIT